MNNITVDTNRVNGLPAVWQAGIAILAKDGFKRQIQGSLSARQACRDLGVSRSQGYDAARFILSQLSKLKGGPQAQNSQKELDACKKQIRKLAFERDVLRFELDHPEARDFNQRQHFTDEYKRYILGQSKNYGLSLVDVSVILAISVETLKKFSRAEKSKLPKTDQVKKLPDHVFKIINLYLRSSGKIKSVKKFYCRNHNIFKELGLSYRQVCAWFLHLGLSNPKGIFLRNNGFDKVLRFSPNAIWGSDGKFIKIIINGQVYQWVWQCLIDYKTTVIVGGIIGESETTDHLLEAIKQSKNKTGISPVAIVIDNRLSENLPAIRQYLDQYGIMVVNTFPGNPKSAGITEGNFSIFERWCGGTVAVNGQTNQEISRSIAKLVVEIFTQLRSHRPKKTLSHKTPKETLDESPPVSDEQRGKIKEIMRAIQIRQKNDAARPETSEQKKSAIDKVISEFNPPCEDSFRKKLAPSYYTADLILQALAILKTQRSRYPEKTFDHNYFGGILRNLVDQEHLMILHENLSQLYLHHWESMATLNSEQLHQSLKADPIHTCTRLASDFIHMPIPACATLILKHLKEAFIIAALSGTSKVSEFREELLKKLLSWHRADRSKRETLIRKFFEWENLLKSYV